MKMNNRQNYHRQIFNYSAGPSLLPDTVLEQIEQDLWDWNGTKSSIMEIGHRTDLFIDILNETKDVLRKIMGIPNNYHILFLHGGARGQFAAVPLNLLNNKQADYINSGYWSKLAIDEAKKYGKINIASSGEKYNFNKLDEQNKWNLNPNASYVHMTYNETIKGVEYPFIPNTGDIPLVVDTTSNILSKEIDVTKFGIIYAGAQKNLGIAGVTIVIIRDDLLKKANNHCPSILDYSHQAKVNSFGNTPSTFPIYVSNLVAKWVDSVGGVAKIQKNNQTKAKKVYDCIDSSEFYINHVDKSWRSMVNVHFYVHDSKLENVFLEEAYKANLYYLKGHASSKGIRANMYNAAPIEYATKLVEFMTYFENKYG